MTTALRDARRLRRCDARNWATSSSRGPRFHRHRAARDFTVIARPSISPSLRRPQLGNVVIARPEGPWRSRSGLDCFGLRPRNDDGAPRRPPTSPLRRPQLGNFVIARPSSPSSRGRNLATSSSRGPKGRGDPGAVWIASGCALAMTGSSQSPAARADIAPQGRALRRHVKPS